MQSITEIQAGGIESVTEDIILRLLHSLPESWKHKITALKKNCGIGITRFGLHNK